MDLQSATSGNSQHANNWELARGRTFRPKIQFRFSEQNYKDDDTRLTN